MEFSYEHFVNCLVEGDYNQFWYKDSILVFQSTKKESNFYIERNGLIAFKQKYKTPQELLDNVRIDGKSLKEIWDDLKIA